VNSRIAVTGANSAVGQAVLREVASSWLDTAIVACVRSERAESELPPLPADGVSCIARVRYDDIDSLERAFRGDPPAAVLHLPGVLVERADSTYEAANVETTRSVVRAAQSAGARKLVLVSAVGADASSRNRYYRTKGVAEQLVRDSGLDFAIVRAPLVLGPGTEGARATRRNAAQRTAWLLGGGRNLQQPLHVVDLARGALRATLPGVASGRSLDLVGPEVLPDREVMQRGARMLGHELRVRSLPTALVRLGAAVRTRLAGPGFSPDAIDVITADTDLDSGPAAKTLGIELTPLDAAIRASVQEDDA